MTSAKRILSTILAAVVFVASINCVCHAAPAGPSPLEQRKSCCADGPNRHASDPSAPQHDAKCVHCQRSMMNDTLAGKQLIATFDFCCFAPVDAVHPSREQQI